jgi:hypothetical protein
MSDSSNGDATKDRAERLRDYVYFDAISLFIANLGKSSTDVLGGVVPEDYLEADKLVDLGGMSELWPGDTEGDEEFDRTDALATVVTGEMFLTLAASSDELAAEGRRLVGLGRRRLEKETTRAARGDSDA